MLRATSLRELFCFLNHLHPELGLMRIVVVVVVVGSTDQAVSDNVTKLKDELLEASFAGDSVVDECH